MNPLEEPPGFLLSAQESVSVQWPCQTIEHSWKAALGDEADTRADDLASFCAGSDVRDAKNAVRWVSDSPAAFAAFEIAPC